MTVKAESTNIQSSEPIILVCAADDNYAMPLAVMLRSVLENLSDERSLEVFVIDGGIEERNKQKIVESVDSNRVEIKWLQPLSALLSELEVSWYYTKTVYYRLFITELLPESYRKVIYLDSDVIVVEDLGKLWDIDMEDHYISAVQDQYPIKNEYLLAIQNLKSLPTVKPPLSSKMSLADTHASLQSIDSKDYKPFFNAGVLVINLDKWRTEKVGVEIIEFLRESKQYSLNDQDGLNIFFRDQWKKLDPRWNQTAGIYECQAWVKKVFSEEQLKDLASNPSIIHFTSADKPWNSIGRHPAQSLFYKYLDKTAWIGWRFTQWKRIQSKIARETKKIRKRLNVNV